jgi:hypothetical protein
MERGVPKEAEARIARNRPSTAFGKVHHDGHNVALRHPSFCAYADYMETNVFALA